MPHRNSISLDDDYTPDDYDRARTPEYIDDPGDYIDPDTPARDDGPRRSRIPAHAPQPQDYRPKQRRKPKRGGRRGPIPRDRATVDDRGQDPVDDVDGVRPVPDRSDDRYEDDQPRPRRYRDEDDRYEDDRPRYRDDDQPRPRRYRDEDDRYEDDRLRYRDDDRAPTRRSESDRRPRRSRYYDRTDGPIRREANGIDVVDVHHDGDQWTIPADVMDWNIEATVAFEEGRAVTAVRNLLGEKQYRALIAKKYTNRDFQRLFDKLAKAGGFESAGN